MFITSLVLVVLGLICIAIIAIALLFLPLCVLIDPTILTTTDNR
jgi:hypothetical protein